MRRYHSAPEEEDEPMFPPDDREWEEFGKNDGEVMTPQEAMVHAVRSDEGLDDWYHCYEDWGYEDEP